MSDKIGFHVHVNEICYNFYFFFLDFSYLTKSLQNNLCWHKYQREELMMI